MKIKQYIVTYNNSFQINKCLKSIFESLHSSELDMLDITIINNHSNFSINDEFKDKVNVIHNKLRPDFSTGHLSRNWNEAIVNGFQNLLNPNCDILITNQDDVEFQTNYVTKLIELHNQYDFLQFGAGDAFNSYTSNHIKVVGLWDERFCNIGYQEADYFFRSVIYNGAKISLNDEFHKRTHNKIPNTITKDTESGYQRGESYHRESAVHHELSRSIFIKKWGFPPSDSTGEAIKLNSNNITIKSPNIESFIYYPYFEKDINRDSLEIQKFII